MADTSLQDAVETIREALASMRAGERKELLNEIFYGYCDLCGAVEPCWCGCDE